MPPTNNGSTKDVQPPVVQVQPHVPNSEPVVAPVSAQKPNPKPSIPYPSRLNDQKIREKANNQIEKFYQIFQDLHFDISFADALILMPKFASTLKSLISNKEKLFELARTPLNEHCSAVLLKKLPEKLGDPGKFLIPLVMSADSAVTYILCHFEARSWSIPSEDPYEEAARQLLEQAPHSLEYVPDPIELEDHVPVYIPEPEHPEDLVPAEDEAPTPLLPPFFLSPRIRPPRTRAAMAQMRATAPSTYHPLLPSGTPPLLPIPLPTPSTIHRADIPEATTYYS
ncbi:hypothetical protein Tco_0445113 [Tanacetum coccineum]